MIASCEVAEVRAQNYKPHFTEKELNLPVCKETVKVIFGPAVMEEMMKVPLSENMVDRTIKYNERLHTGEKFSLQLDGSVYVRNIQVNFFCKIYG